MHGLENVQPRHAQELTDVDHKSGSLFDTRTECGNKKKVTHKMLDNSRLA